MHAVGDVADGNFVFRLAGIKAGPHGARNFAVQRGDGVGAPRKLQAQHRHAEFFVVIAGILAAQPHELLRAKCPSASRSGPRCSSIRSGIEAVVTGGHGRVRGEDDFARNARHGLVEAEPFVLHAAANGFEHGKAAVPFVQVQHAGSDAHRLAARGRRRRPAATPGGCARGRRRRRAARSARDLRERCLPRWNRAGAGRSGRLSRARLWPGWRRSRVSICTMTGSPLVPMAGSIGSWLTSRLQIFFLLPAVAIEPLAEISLAIKQSDADQRNAEVGSALDVIAGEDAQAAGINRQRFVQAELGGEIGDRPRPQDAGMLRAPGAVRLQIFPLAAVGVVDAAVQHELAGAAFDAGKRKFRASSDTGLWLSCAPAHRIEIAKQAGGVVVPAPPEIARQRPQAFLRGAIKRSSVRASLTTGATCAAASTSMRISSS